MYREACFHLISVERQVERQCLNFTDLPCELDDMLSQCVSALSVAADRGHGEALYQLAMMYERGCGVARDPIMAEKLLRRSTECGVTLSMLTRKGTGIR